MNKEAKNKPLLEFMVLVLQLIGILVLQMVHVLKHAQYKYSNGTELKKIFQQKILLDKPLQVLVVMLRMNVKI